MSDEMCKIRTDYKSPHFCDQSNTETAAGLRLGTPTRNLKRNPTYLFFLGFALLHAFLNLSVLAGLPIKMLGASAA